MISAHSILKRTYEQSRGSPLQIELFCGLLDAFFCRGRMRTETRNSLGDLREDLTSESVFTRQILPHHLSGPRNGKNRILMPTCACRSALTPTHSNHHRESGTWDAEMYSNRTWKEFLANDRYSREESCGYRRFWSVV